MKNIFVVGGSKGIGNTIVNTLVKDANIINISKTKTTNTHQYLTHHTCDVLTDELPIIVSPDTIIYYPESISLIPISNLSLDRFKGYFEINAIGALKSIQAYLKALKKAYTSSIPLFSDIVLKLEMSYHGGVTTSESSVSM